MANKMVPPAAAHKTTLNDAKLRIAAHRLAMQNRGTVHSTIKGGVFNKDFIQQIINAPNCSGVRFYFAKVRGSEVESDPANGAEDIPTVVLVAVDQDGNDILNVNTEGFLLFGGDNSWPCPPHCRASNIE